MKNLWLLGTLVIFCLPLSASAQESAPRVEIFGGYSFLRLNLGADPTLGNLGSVDLNGFDTSIAGNFTRHVGVVGEFGFYRTSLSNIATLGTASGDAEVLTFLTGPRVVLHRGRIEPFVQGLFGAARASASATTIPATTTATTSLLSGFTSGQAGYAFAYALGGGVDLRLNRNIAIRLGQIDYLGANVNSQQLNNFRYSAGIVFRLANRH